MKRLDENITAHTNNEYKPQKMRHLKKFPEENVLLEDDNCKMIDFHTGQNIDKCHPAYVDSFV